MTTQIKEKTLIPYADAFSIEQTGILPRDVIAKLKEAAERIGAECNVEMGEIISGNWLSSNTDPCIVIIHSDYVTRQRYLGFCIRLRENGKFTIVSIYTFGKSEQLGAEATLQKKTFTGNTARGVVAGALRGGATGAGFAVGSLMAGTVLGGARLIGKGLAAMTKDTKALEKEKDWYSLIDMILHATFFEE